MNKRIFIIPGFKQKASDAQFSWLKIFLKKNGFDVFMVSIKWNYKTISDCVLYFKDFYNKNRGDNNYILGFSYGAVIALISANDLKPKKIYLCSLSPDFKEDLKGMKRWILKYIGKKRVNDLKNRSAIKITKELNVPVVIFYGEKEGIMYPNLKKRSLETNRLAKKSKLVVIKNCHHDISCLEYKVAIKKEFYEQ